MIFVILYTLLLLFTDRDAAQVMCMQALKQWYETMIPALFPMMLLSSILVDTGFAAKIGHLLNTTLLRFLKVSDNGCYCLLTGFLFGFPMGAKTTADMHLKHNLSKKEAEYLLTFINSIGPMYTINFTYRCFPNLNLWKILIGIYGLSLLYGVCTRYTLYRGCNFRASSHTNTIKATPATSDTGITTHTCTLGLSLPDALYESVPKCGRSILMLGGYMVLFQLFFVTLGHFLKSINLQTHSLYPLLEITGGLNLLPADTELPPVLFYTNLGGACCILQTYSFLKPAGLSVRKYVIHKCILAVVSYIIGGLIV